MKTKSTILLLLSLLLSFSGFGQNLFSKSKFQNIEYKNNKLLLDKSKLYSSIVTNLKSHQKQGSIIEVEFEEEINLTELNHNFDITLQDNANAIYSLKKELKKYNLKSNKKILFDKIIYEILEKEISILLLNSKGEKHYLGTFKKNSSNLNLEVYENYKGLSKEPTILDKIKGIYQFDTTKLTEALRLKKVEFNHPLIGNVNPNIFTYEILDGDAVFQDDIYIGSPNNIFSEPSPHKIPISRIELKEKYCPNCTASDEVIVNPIGQTEFGLLSSAYRDNESGKYLWWRGQVPFEIDDDFTSTEEDTIRMNLNILNSRTNVNLYDRFDEEDYIFFKKDNNLSAAGRSCIGRQGGKQNIKINTNRWNTDRTVIHEVLHSLGIWHEHSRQDRDAEVDVLISNVKFFKRHNFHVMGNNFWEGTAYTPTNYDVRSIMHYGGCAFSKDDSSPCDSNHPRPTIVDRSTGNPVSARVTLSTDDINGLNEIYPSDIVNNYVEMPSQNEHRVVTLSIEGVRAVSADDFWRGLDIYSLLRAAPDYGWNRRNTPFLEEIRTTSFPLNLSPNIKKYKPIKQEDVIHPNWNVEVILQPNQRYCQFNMKFRDSDKLSSDDDLDIGPNNKYSAYIIVDTVENEIWLANEDIEMEDLLGELGMRIELQGFSENIGTIAAEFILDIETISESELISNPMFRN